jgi:uncharacterized Zn-binding protein involved in type VI secretion
VDWDNIYSLIAHKGSNNMPAMNVLDNQTDYWGSVIDESITTTTHGKQVARVGDRVICPKKGLNNLDIVKRPLSSADTVSSATS